MAADRSINSSSRRCNRAREKGDWEQGSTPVVLACLDGSGRPGRHRRGGRHAAALREAEEEDEVLDDDAARLVAVLGVQEEEDDAAVSFPSLAWRGGVWWLD
jgi:hypothetical protein